MGKYRLGSKVRNYNKRGKQVIESSSSGSGIAVNLDASPLKAVFDKVHVSESSSWSPESDVLGVAKTKAFVDTLRPGTPLQKQMAIEDIFHPDQHLRNIQFNNAGTASRQGVIPISRDSSVTPTRDVTDPALFPKHGVGSATVSAGKGAGFFDNRSVNVGIGVSGPEVPPDPKSGVINTPSVVGKVFGKYGSDMRSKPLRAETFWLQPAVNEVDANSINDPAFTHRMRAVTQSRQLEIDRRRELDWYSGKHALNYGPANEIKEGFDPKKLEGYGLLEGEGWGKGAKRAYRSKPHSERIERAYERALEERAKGLEKANKEQTQQTRHSEAYTKNLERINKSYKSVGEGSSTHALSRDREMYERGKREAAEMSSAYGRSLYGKSWGLDEGDGAGGGRRSGGGGGVVGGGGGRSGRQLKRRWISGQVYDPLQPRRRRRRGHFWEQARHAATWQLYTPVLSEMMAAGNFILGREDPIGRAQYDLVGVGFDRKQRDASKNWALAQGQPFRTAQQHLKALKETASAYGEPVTNANMADVRKISLFAEAASQYTMETPGNTVRFQGKLVNLLRHSPKYKNLSTADLFVKSMEHTMGIMQQGTEHGADFNRVAEQALPSMMNAGWSVSESYGLISTMINRVGVRSGPALQRIASGVGIYERMARTKMVTDKIRELVKNKYGDTDEGRKRALWEAKKTMEGGKYWKQHGQELQAEGRRIKNQMHGSARDRAVAMSNYSKDFFFLAKNYIPKGRAEPFVEKSMIPVMEAYASESPDTLTNEVMQKGNANGVDLQKQVHDLYTENTSVAQWKRGDNKWKARYYPVQEKVGGYLSGAYEGTADNADLADALVAAQKIKDPNKRKEELARLIALSRHKKQFNPWVNEISFKDVQGTAQAELREKASPMGKALESILGGGLNAYFGFTGSEYSKIPFPARVPTLDQAIGFPSELRHEDEYLPSAERISKFEKEYKNNRIPIVNEGAGGVTVQVNILNGQVEVVTNQGRQSPTNKKVDGQNSSTVRVPFGGPTTQQTATQVYPSSQEMKLP